jgi:trehalose 6-phosphate phosphatase
MKHLFLDWEPFLVKCKSARQIMLLSDYDGTLAPIAETPELAKLPEATRGILEKLSRQPRFNIGLISGRAIEDLKRLVGIEDIIYAGNHGLEMEGPGFQYVYPLAEDVKSGFRVMFQVLKKTLSKISGVIVEDKGPTISVHYRQVDPEQVEEVNNIFQRVVGAAKVLNMVKITSGKKVLEVRPHVDWNKGSAIELLIKQYKKDGDKGMLPIYLGDDTTDEDAFREVNKYAGGFTIFVGDRAAVSAARYYLSSTSEVNTLLAELPGVFKK